MSKTNSIRLNQAKNKITGWLDESQIKWEDIPEDKRGNTNFMIKIGERNETLVYDSPRHPERIALKQTVKIGNDHRELTKNMEPKEWNELVIDIQDKILTYGFEYGIVTDKDDSHQINFVDMYAFIYLDDLTKNNFYHQLVGIEQAQAALFNRISAKLGPTTRIEKPKEPEFRPGVT